jgi:hypothetical protein
MENCTENKQKHMKINRKNNRNYRYILIDLSAYNVQSIANVLFGYGVYCLLVELMFSNSLVAFKYL